MLLQIGQKPESDFTEPIGMLEDCHKRILYFLKQLVSLAGTAEGESLDDSRRKSLEAALKYFREGAPRHNADEEESLFPHLRRASSPQVSALLGRLDALEDDHRSADAQHREVDVIGRRWLSQGMLAEEERSRLKLLLDSLSRMYERHIALEETEVFPAARAILSESEKQMVGTEMSQRRGITLQN